MDKIMYFKPNPSCYDVSNDMVSNRPSQKDLRSNPTPSPLPRTKRKSKVCSEDKEVFLKSVYFLQFSYYLFFEYLNN